MMLHIDSRWFALYVCIGKSYDINRDEFRKPGVCIRIGRHVWSNWNGYRNLRCPQ